MAQSLSFVSVSTCILRGTLGRRFEERGSSWSHPISFQNDSPGDANFIKSGDSSSPDSNAECFEPASVSTVRRKRGPRQGKDMRRCVMTRERYPRQSLWRIVRRSFGGVTLDTGQGRSAYISQTREAVFNAKAKLKLQRALKAPVPGEIMTELRRRVLLIEGDQTSADATTVLDEQ